MKAMMRPIRSDDQGHAFQCSSRMRGELSLRATPQRHDEHLGRCSCEAPLQACPERTLVQLDCVL
jgi:hypothetical protein